MIAEINLKPNKQMFHTDTITKKEAIQLGIINNAGLGFVKPQTAFKNITEQLLAETKKGNLVWRQAWKSGVVVKGKTYGPQNYETQRPYTGGNAFFIHIQNLLNGTNYNFFLTPKQIAARGGKLMKGAKPFPVSVFIKNVTEKTVTRKGEQVTYLEEERGVIWYHVFPIDLVEGLTPIVRKTLKPDTFNEVIVSDADMIIEGMPKAPPIKLGGDKAFYSPQADYVQMPHKKAFEVQQNYYSVLFHELIHSTGHSKRLDRGNNTRNRDGSKEDKKAYAFEELVAEIGAAFLCGVCEINYFTINNSAAYLKSWASHLTDEIKEDPNFLKRAVFKAVKAANFIIGKTLEKHGEVKSTEGEIKTTTVAKAKEKHYPGKEITPNKSVKASVGKAIEGLMSINPDLKRRGAMFLGMFYSDFKDKEEIENIKSPMKVALYKKNEDLFEEIVYLYENRYKEVGIEMAFLNIDGHEVMTKIEARLKTLKAKKSGTDLFPELAGNIATKASDIKFKIATGGTYEGYGVAEYKFGTIVKTGAGYQVSFGVPKQVFKHLNLADAIKKIDNYSETKITGKNLQGVTDALLLFLNSFLGLDNSVVTRENLLHLINTLHASVKKNPIKKDHPLKDLVNTTQEKITDLINCLREGEKIKLVISNKKEIENKIESLQGLGFWNVIASAVIGKGAELLAQKHIFKKDNKPQTLNGIEGFTRADKSAAVTIANTFRLNGELGKFLLDIQPYKYSIVLTGDPHAGKTEFVMQLANGFADIGKTVGAFMLEQGGLESKDTKAAIDRNITDKNKQNVFITGEAAKGINTVKECANKFNVVIVDSWQKLGIPSTKFDELRHEFPNTIFIVIFQQNGEGGTRGGVSADYDTPVLLKVHKVDSTFKNNYVEMKKNRGNSNSLGLKYMVKAKKTVLNNNL